MTELEIEAMYQREIAKAEAEYNHAIEQAEIRKDERLQELQDAMEED